MQITLLAERLDDYIAEDNPVRAVDAFIDELDLSELGFAGAQSAATDGDDRVQRGERHEVAAVQYRPSAERFRLRDARGKRLTTVVAVGNDADFQATRSGILYPYRAFFAGGIILLACAAPGAFRISAKKGP